MVDQDAAVFALRKRSTHVHHEFNRVHRIASEIERGGAYQRPGTLRQKRFCAVRFAIVRIAMEGSPTTLDPSPELQRTALQSPLVAMPLRRESSHLGARFLLEYTAHRSCLRVNFRNGFGKCFPLSSIPHSRGSTSAIPTSAAIQRLHSWPA